MAGVVVVGAQWGDEGKGKIVDWLSSRADVIVRFQGGHNAGHTLVIDGKVFKLNLLPSGVVRGGKLSIIGNGVVVDPWHLLNEIASIGQSGVHLGPDDLILADNAVLILPWPLLLLNLEPARLHGWLNTELVPLRTPFSLPGAARFLSLLPWFAFPALPLAGWTLWIRRKELRAAPQMLPLVFILFTLLMLALAYRPREIPALLMLPPLALLATPGALALRRGAANAFDWFARMCFSVFAGVIWLCWSAMALGWPEKLAKRVVVLRPGFVGTFDGIALLIGLGATAWWIWLIITAPRSPYRALTHWTLGCTTLWLMATTLILPWFDYGKSYRPVALAVAQALPKDHACLAERGLSDGQRASLSYFVEIEPAAYTSSAGKACNWLLVTGESRQDLAAPGKEWETIWEGNRPGERREKFRLFRR